MPDQPAWTDFVHLDQWPTRRIGSRELHYAVPLPAAWSIEPEQQSTPYEIEQVFHGPLPGEQLVVSFMAAADPDDEMRLWVDGPLEILGFPVPTLHAEGGKPELLLWTYHDLPPLTERLAADEVHGYDGLALLPGTPATLARIYILLARRGTRAWKITLCLESACPPGTPDEIVVANDHRRGGATFGDLALLDGDL